LFGSTLVVKIKKAGITPVAPHRESLQPRPKFRIRGGGGGDFLREFKDEPAVINVTVFSEK